MTSVGGDVVELTAQHLDELYTKLCYGLTERGMADTPLVLARLSLLLMRAVGDPVVIARAIDDALKLPTEA